MIKQATKKDLKEFGLMPENPKPRAPDSIVKEQQSTQVIFEESFYSVGSDGVGRYNNAFVGENKPLREDGFQKLDFLTSSQLLCWFNQFFNDGTYNLYEWQKDISKELCIPDKKPTAKEPIKYCVCAANGSGKDAFVTAPFAVWFVLTKIKARVIITSSSGVQLTAQTEHYIRDLANSVNKKLGEEIFKINQRYIYCRLTGSEIRMFATDEAGKAEGYHPIEPGAEMAIIVNEAKSVDEIIFEALSRCTGYNYWLNISSPGQPFGSFYDSYTNWEYARRVTSMDCPEHLSEQERLEDLRKLGEHSALYRSKHLALFTSLEGQVFITKELIDAALNMEIPWVGQNWPDRIGLDFAAGGDETVLCRWKGNKRLNQEVTREKDTTLQTDWIIEHLVSWKIPKNHEYIRGDDGGIGHGSIDQLRRRGWNVKRMLNQSKAIDTDHHVNRGSELWFKMKRFCEEYFIIIPSDDKKLQVQLYNRYYKQGVTTVRTALESKKEAKAHGRPSPDRADGMILAFADVTVEMFFAEFKKLDRTIVVKKDIITDPAMLEQKIDDFSLNGYKTNKVRNNGTKSHYSVNALLSVYNN